MPLSVGDVRSGVGTLIDFDSLVEWMDGAGLPAGGIRRVERLAGGTQNVMVRFERGGRRYVLRRPPEHPRSWSNDALRREMVIVRALSGTAVPHPRWVAGCDDESVLGDVVFYLMEEVDGVNVGQRLPDSLRSSGRVRELGERTVDALATLVEVDLDAAGLSSLGRPEGFLERQVHRWLGQLDSYTEHEGYPGPDLPSLDDIATWLESNRPADAEATLMHGDFQLTNLLFGPDRAEVRAIVDWEMATVGDPLVDLGWLLATWPLGDSPIAALRPLVGSAGLSSPADLATRYERVTGRDTSAIDWYVVLACFKLGIVVEGTYARACAGLAPPALGDEMRDTAKSLFTRANQILKGGLSLLS